MLLIEEPVWIYFKHETLRPRYVTSRSGAKYLVSLGLGTLNQRETRLRLRYKQGDPALKFIEGSPERFPRFQRAQSLTIGQSVMEKAAIEDSGYHQMLAEAYRRSPDDHKHNKTRL